MLRKLFVFILLVTQTCIVTFAQDAPKPDKEKADRVFSLPFGGSGSYMGIEIKEVTKENFSEMGLSEVRGVGVSKVLKDSPAEKAGLLAGDVIIRFNGETVTSQRKLTRLISEIAPDHNANVTVIRSGSEIEIPITIGKRPVPQFFSGNFEFPKMDLPKGDFPEIETIIPKGQGPESLVWRMYSGRSIGVGVTPLTKQLAEFFGVNEGEGLLVNRITKDSPAERAGLRAGDVIIEVDGKKTIGASDLIRSIYEKKEGDVNLTIIRNKNRQTITVTPEKRKDSETFFNGVQIMPGKVKIPAAPKVTGVTMPVIIRESGVIL